MSLRIIAGATLLTLVATDAQNAASVSGNYCGTWASGNSWQMTLQQNGTSVSASVTGRRPDGGTNSGWSAFGIYAVSPGITRKTTQTSSKTSCFAICTVRDRPAARYPAPRSC